MVKIHKLTFVPLPNDASKSNQINPLLLHFLRIELRRNAYGLLVVHYVNVKIQYFFKFAFV